MTDAALGPHGEKIMAENQQAALGPVDEYESAFDEFAGDRPGDTADPAESAETGGDTSETVEPEATADGPDEPAQDPGAADDDDPIAAARREAEEWRHKYQSDQGRQAALQRKIQEQQAELERYRHQSGSRPDPTAPAELGSNPDGSGMSDAEWRALKEDFPEIAAAMEARLSEVSRQYEGRIAQLEQQVQPIQEQQRQQFLSSQYAALQERHPDYREVAESAEFQQWLSLQPRQVQTMIDSDAAEDASWLLDAYKRANLTAQQQDAESMQARRQRQLQQARSVSGRSGRGASGQPPADDYEAAFDYYAERG
jgi:hypothetical protein